MNTHIIEYMRFKTFNAFTLAEVLIAMIIVGVIAAITVPSILQSVQKRELAAAFKKSYSQLSDAFNLTIIDGYDIFVLNPTESRPDGDVDWNPEFARVVYSKYNKLQKIDGKTKREYAQKTRNFSKKKLVGVPQCSQLFAGSDAFIAMDGSAISIMQNCHSLWFTIDTNGVSKGPNALGHDVFLFVAPANGKALLPATSESEVKLNEDGKYVYNNTSETKEKCSFKSQSDINGVTCATYAIIDKCPDGSGRGYWDCLP